MVKTFIEDQSFRSLEDHKSIKLHRLNCMHRRLKFCFMSVGLIGGYCSCDDRLRAVLHPPFQYAAMSWSCTISSQRLNTSCFASHPQIRPWMSLRVAQFDQNGTPMIKFSGLVGLVTYISYTTFLLSSTGWKFILLEVVVGGSQCCYSELR